MIAAYVTFNGNTEEAFNFYASALEGKDHKSSAFW